MVTEFCKKYCKMEERRRSFFARLIIRNAQWRAFIAALCSIAAIVLFFCAPANSEWLRDKIIGSLQDIKKEHTVMGIEERMQYRFDSNYIYSKQISHLFEEKGIKNTALVLVPPTTYFALKKMNYHVPEPVVFYYYTGLKIVWGDNRNAADANWHVYIDNGRFTLDSVSNRQSLQDTISAYKKLGIAL